MDGNFLIVHVEYILMHLSSLLLLFTVFDRKNYKKFCKILVKATLFNICLCLQIIHAFYLILSVFSSTMCVVLTFVVYYGQCFEISWHELRYSNKTETQKQCLLASHATAAWAVHVSWKFLLNIFSPRWMSCNMPVWLAVFLRWTMPCYWWSCIMDFR